MKKIKRINKLLLMPLLVFLMFIGNGLTVFANPEEAVQSSNINKQVDKKYIVKFKTQTGLNDFLGNKEFKNKKKRS